MNGRTCGDGVEYRQYYLHRVSSTRVTPKTPEPTSQPAGYQCHRRTIEFHSSVLHELVSKQDLFARLCLRPEHRNVAGMELIRKGRVAAHYVNAMHTYYRYYAYTQMYASRIMGHLADAQLLERLIISGPKTMLLSSPFSMSSRSVEAKLLWGFSLDKLQSSEPDYSRFSNIPAYG